MFVHNRRIMWMSNTIQPTFTRASRWRVLWVINTMLSRGVTTDELTSRKAASSCTRRDDRDLPVCFTTSRRWRRAGNSLRNSKNPSKLSWNDGSIVDGRDCTVTTPRDTNTRMWRFICRTLYNGMVHCRYTKYKMICHSCGNSPSVFSFCNIATDSCIMRA